MTLILLFVKINTMNEEYLLVREKQEEYFKSGSTLDIKERIKNLKTLKCAMKSNENLLLDALNKDLGKSSLDIYLRITVFNTQ